MPWVVSAKPLISMNIMTYQCNTTWEYHGVYSLGRFKNKIDIRTVGICKLWILWIHKKNNKTVIELNRIWSETIEYIIKYTIWWRVCEANIEKRQKIINISWKFMKIIRIKISWKISCHDVLNISTWCNDDTN